MGGKSRIKAGSREGLGGGGVGVEGGTAEVLASVPWRAAALHLLSARAWNCRLMGFSAPWPPPSQHPSGGLPPAQRGEPAARRHGRKEPVAGAGGVGEEVGGGARPAAPLI